MGQILIRNLDDAVLMALRDRAATKGLSLEEETRRALTASVDLSKEVTVAAMDELRKKIGRLAGPSSLDDLRADRARDNDDA